MRPLLILLLCAAAVLLVYRVAFFTPPEQDSVAAEGNGLVEVYGQPANPPSWQLDPPEGEIPPEPAQIEVWHEVRQDGRHHRLHVFLREAHGWWVDRIYIRFWYQDSDESTGETIQYKTTSEFIPLPIDFGETIEHSFVIYETDLPAGKEKGTTDNWVVEVQSWDEARVRMPLSP